MHWEQQNAWGVQDKDFETKTKTRGRDLYADK